MVSLLLSDCLNRVGIVLAQAEAVTPKSLDPKVRARLLVAVTSLALLGVFLIALAWLALRMTRRYVDRSSAAALRRPDTELQADDWAQKPMVHEAVQRPRDE